MNVPERIDTAGRTSLVHPVASASTGYYGRPLLKKPVWTWEIPIYFFIGGAAGAAALIAEIASLCRADQRLVRDARRIAAAGGMLAPVLLVSDLGRPERFLYMLRVFKPQSPMSAGVWTVLSFSNAAALAAGIDVAPRRVRTSWIGRVVGRLISATAAATGLGMSTYTGVLLGVTAIPVWRQHVRLLPLHFAFSGVATASSILQLLGHRERALHRLALMAAAVETGVGAVLESGGSASNDPLRHGRSGRLMRAAGLLSGPIPLALRILGRRSRVLTFAAAASAVAGSLLTRLAWIEAGGTSAQDPGIPLALEKKGREKRGQSPFW
ncbi:MAG TPA: NrfD/PsrC family molybdoenzyme membrane anchor subunit [Vicinamibacterales bacterium]